MPRAAPLLALLACASAPAAAPPRTWTEVTPAAAFPPSYNFPVFTVGREMWAVTGDGAWRSRDGAAWTRTALPASDTNPAYLHVLGFDDAVHALGALQGDYRGFTIDTRIARTRDLERWEVVAATSELPHRIFTGAAVHRGALWLLGGYDGAAHHHDVWRSTDAVHWTRVVEAAPWSPRIDPAVVAFNDRLWLIGGGVLDGEIHHDVWSSPDGLAWTRHTDRIAADPVFGYSAVAFDGELWLVGANRSGGFTSAVLHSSDGARWTAADAPWSPRGGVATWVFDGSLFMTGGKHSTVVAGEPVFTYSRDVWSLSPRA